MNKVTKLILLALVFTVIVSAVSCSGSDTVEADTSTCDKPDSLLNEAGYRDIIEGSESSYSIIYSESNEAAKEAAVSLSDKIFDKCGVKLEVLPDTSDESTYEILIGKSSRKRSKAEKRTKNYSVSFVGSKLVVSAGSDEALREAVKALAEYASTGDTFSFPKDAVLTYSYSPDNTVEDGAKDVIIVPSVIVDFMNVKFSRQMVWNFAQGKENLYLPLSLTFSWDDTGDNEFTFLLSENGDFSSPVSVTTKDTYVSVTNLKTETKYYWKVTGDSGNDITQVFTFETAGGQPRTLSVEGVLNTRDVGGYTTQDGEYKIKQGMLYRSASLEKISDSGFETIVSELGIKTEIDLSTPDNGEAFRNSALTSAGVEYINLPILSYSEIFGADEAQKDAQSALRQIFTELADPNNYPILFHSEKGTDRAGTLAAIIEALLGLDQNNIYKEYQLTWFFELNPPEDDARFTQFNDFYTYLRKASFNGNQSALPSLSENTEAFLLQIGVTQEEIDSVRSILLEEISE